jgi:hypothetical protein
MSRPIWSPRRKPIKVADPEKVIDRFAWGSGELVPADEWDGKLVKPTEASFDDAVFDAPEVSGSPFPRSPKPSPNSLGGVGSH